jgi:endoribonuclease Nob1
MPPQIKDNDKYIIILDTSAVLSGKPIDFKNATLLTTPGVSSEINPGGRDYQLFQNLIEKGLIIQQPSKQSIDKIIEVINKTGDSGRLSKTDIEVLALAYEKKDEQENVSIITDDYSIQNTANELNICFETISQSGITKKFKWTYRCRGCGKKFKDNIKICPICGAETKPVISSKKSINK